MASGDISRISMSPIRVGGLGKLDFGTGPLLQWFLHLAEAAKEVLADDVCLFPICGCRFKSRAASLWGLKHPS